MKTKRQTILPYRIEVTAANDGLTSHAGLPLVAETMRAMGLDQATSELLNLRKRNSGLTDYQKVESIVVLMAAGGDCYDDMAVLRSDAGLQRLLGYSLPSPDSVRAFINAFHDEEVIEQAKAGRSPNAIAYIPAEGEHLKALAAINVALCHAVAQQGKSKTATLDHDATIQESHKSQAMPHYKGGVGYQPVAVYWAEQDLVIADEYRDGNVPAAMDNLPLIRRGFRSLPLSITKLYFRADSACYDQNVLRWLANVHRDGGPHGTIGFSISADMTPELRRLCTEIPEDQWQLVDERANETVCCADVEFTPGNWPKNSQPLRYVAVRIKKHQGLLFASGYEQKFLAVVSNRTDISPQQLLRWHWQKAGTIEHIHDVTKNELGAAPPSKYFGANAAWYRFSMLTYNVLSAMKSIALPPTLSAARPNRLRFALFSLAGKIASHAGELVLRISAAADHLVQLARARHRLADLLPC